MKITVKHNILHLTTAFMVVVVLFITAACKTDKKDTIAAVVDRSKMPKLHALDISTVISDSGITRYRISAPVWDVYDQANQPYWNFPKGIHFEQFDPNLRVIANIHSQYAKFQENEQLWELRGKVKAMNIKGELFETEHLFWSQRDERIYSDTVVKITRATYILNTVGFESNQNMTRYSLKDTHGPIAVIEH